MAEVKKCTLMRFNPKEVSEMEQKKTQAQLQQELFEKLSSQNAQFMPEVAMPGVVIPVDAEKK